MYKLKIHSYCDNPSTDHRCVHGRTGTAECAIFIGPIEWFVRDFRMAMQVVTTEQLSRSIYIYIYK